MNFLFFHSALEKLRTYQGNESYWDLVSGFLKKAGVCGRSKFLERDGETVMFQATHLGVKGDGRGLEKVEAALKIVLPDDIKEFYKIWSEILLVLCDPFRLMPVDEIIEANRWEPKYGSCNLVRFAQYDTYSEIHFALRRKFENAPWHIAIWNEMDEVYVSDEDAHSDELDHTQSDLSFTDWLKRMIETDGVPWNVGYKQDRAMGKRIDSDETSSYNKALRLIEKCRVAGVTEINLSAYELGTLPESLFELRTLKKLYLSYCKLTTLSPRIGELTALTELQITHNLLQSLPPEIRELKALTELQISHNLLQTLPPEIGHLGSLKTLQADHNRLRILPAAIGSLTTLTELELRHNELTSLPPEIEGMINLKKLFVSSNQMETLPPEIGTLRKLTNLSVGGNLQILPSELFDLDELEHLSVCENPLSVLNNRIGHLKSLRSLNLVSNMLTSLPPEIGKLSQLDGLYLSGNPLESLPKELRNLTKLEHITLPWAELGLRDESGGGRSVLKVQEILTRYFRSSAK
jgi:Leucine-rich repeat (LRR) protein